MNACPHDLRKLRPLRDVQMYAYDLIMTAINEGEKHIVVQAPCGFGKTLMAAHLADYYISRKMRVCFVAPRLTLIDQAVEVFNREGFLGQIGFIQGHHPLTNFNKPLQVASRDSLVRRKLPKIDILIIKCIFYICSCYTRNFSYISAFTTIQKRIRRFKI